MSRELFSHSSLELYNKWYKCVLFFLFLRWRSVQRHLFWKRPTKTREMFVMALCGPKRTTSVDWLDTPDGLVMFHQNPLCQTAQILHKKKEGSWCGWDVSKKGAKELYIYPFCSCGRVMWVLLSLNFAKICPFPLTYFCVQWISEVCSPSPKEQQAAC